jgi:hypothetical protein
LSLLVITYIPAVVTPSIGRTRPREGRLRPVRVILAIPN